MRNPRGILQTRNAIQLGQKILNHPVFAVANVVLGRLGIHEESQNIQIGILPEGLIVENAPAKI